MNKAEAVFDAMLPPITYEGKCYVCRSPRTVATLSNASFRWRICIADVRQVQRHMHSPAMAADWEGFELRFDDK